MTADALRDRIAQAIESVAHEPGGRPCELCVETADAVMAVLADADPTDLGMEQIGWLCGGKWMPLHAMDRPCGKDQAVYARPRTEEAHTVDVGHVHVLTTPGGPCAPTCPHPDHRTEETPDA